MAIDRRNFLIGAAGASLACTSQPALGVSEQRFVSAWTDGESSAGVSIFSPAGGILSQSALPARGHALALRPGVREMVVFARRPGRFAMVLNAEGRKVPAMFDAEEEHHFFGHGVYSSDGKLLFSTENDIAGERGVLGIRDATGGYKPLGYFPTAGIGPHDVVLLGDRRTIAVANGGISTDPNGRDPIAIAEMQSSLAYIDLRTGDLMESVKLDASHRLLSIRHLAVGSDGVMAFGCQWQGEITDHPPLVGLHRRGRLPEFLTAPIDAHRRLRGYIGSIAVDRAGELLAASSPKGGLVIYWDIASRRYLGTTELADVCGLAEAPRPGDFVLTSGTGKMARIGSGTLTAVATRDFDVHWDNHVLAIS